MRRAWAVLKWSPCGKRPWHFHAFSMLWVWATVVALMLSLPSWLDTPVAFGDVAAAPEDERDLFDYNSPLAFPDGTCMDVVTRVRAACP